MTQNDIDEMHRMHNRGRANKRSHINDAVAHRHAPLLRVARLSLRSRQLRLELQDNVVHATKTANMHKIQPKRKNIVH